MKLWGVRSGDLWTDFDLATDMQFDTTNSAKTGIIVLAEDHTAAVQAVHDVLAGWNTQESDFVVGTVNEIPLTDAGVVLVAYP